MATKLIRLRNDKTTIYEAAKTLSLAFSDDLLIKWLRPGATLWSDLEQQSMKWQCRRVQRFNCDHAVFYLDAKGTALTNNDDFPRELTTIAMVELPKSHRRFSLMKMILRLKIFVLELFDPCEDAGASDQRIAIMMDAHNEALEEIRAKLYPQDPMYVEVVAVHPSYQGQGLGGRLMKAVIDLAEVPIVLECTDPGNLMFYKRFGFELVKEVVLEDPACPRDKIVLYIMLRR